ncbi:hypothetical protein DL766_006371 [Monosporascus sp. MC13-8B]|uniref:NAD(P)-binding protein n=1 Tax=Monosporascus cannonballus TaxID=155416 RepID=A0ABY0GYE6_9PEZI|nr:hypothetical protein DL762_007984 [Monosporascus cannonballus]RYO84784.1 hypothetical protein DL763_007349 [Monosporascus cannonballus]RYP27461.1 hypothetical protein DL766_006371 [Monosporascus sp. MC13-8B]
MPSYVITGAFRGLGFEMLRQISSNPDNTFIALVRDKPATEKKISEELGGRKLPLTPPLAPVAGLDYLIAKGAYLRLWDAYYPIGVLGQNPTKLEDEALKLFKTNIIGNIHLYNYFMPLILKGQAKKVVAITSGLSDMEVVRKFDLELTPLYAITKARLNMLAAKFSAQYKKDGVLFLSIFPGMVEVGHYKDATPEQMEAIKGMARFLQYVPHFKGPATPEEAVKDVISVWERASIERGDAGNFVSHHGNKEWL